MSSQMTPEQHEQHAISDAMAEIATAAKEAVKRNEHTAAALKRAEKALDRLALMGRAGGIWRAGGDSAILSQTFEDARVRQTFLDAEARHLEAHKALVALERHVREANRSSRLQQQRGG